MRAKAKTKRIAEPNPNAGWHNEQFVSSPTQVIQGNTYRDRSTVIFIPSLGSLSVRAVQAYNNLMKPMNQKVTQIYLVNDEVGKAYQQMVEIVRTNPELKKWKYVLTLEHDNLPPPDGLLKLYEDIEKGPYDAVGGLYWLKGEGGKPMAYGKPYDDYGAPILPMNFVPWLPPLDTVAEVNGLGMGFTLFKTSMLLDPKLPQPLFMTEQSYTPGVGVRAYTQDLRAFEILKRHGYRFAISTRVRVGHYDQANDKVW
jgi:hypothetical protein